LNSHDSFPLLVSYHRNSPSLRTCEMFHNIISFYCKKLLASHPAPKLKNHPFSAVHNYLLKIFIMTTHIRRSFLQYTCMNAINHYPQCFNCHNFKIYQPNVQA
jgi:hypothetical protein